MRLQKLHLRNFKGVRDFTLPANGQSVAIFGANETGKTTVADALTWLLFGKDTRGRSADSFGIKTRDEEGDIIHGLEHEVEGVFEDITLKRTYKEKWTKKRGASKEVHDGHTTDYHIDGVPVKANEYQDAIAEIMPEELFKMLTIVDYFPEQMHWTDRREVLFDLVGDIDTEDIIANYGDLERYPDVLGDRSHDSQEKVLKNRKKDLNDNLDHIPDRIDELNGRLYNDVGDVSEAKATVDELKAKKETIEAKKNKVKSGGQVAEWEKEKSELEAEKQMAKNEHQESIQENLADQRQKVNDLQDKVDEAESDWREAKREYESLEDSLNNKQETIEAIEEEIQEIKDREPKAASDFGPDVCRVCERPMEDDEEHDYEAYLEEFNEKKANDLKDKKNELQEAEDKAETVEAQLQIAEDKASKAKGKLSQRKQALEKAENKLKQQKENQPDFELTDKADELNTQIEEIESKIANYKQEKQSQIEALDDEIAKVDEKIEAAQQTIHQAKENKRTHERISELQQERDEVAEELDQVEADLHLMEEFVRARSAYVTDKVNSMFAHVEWKLFEEQINGGISETCDAIYKGVPYSEGLNNAGRIKAGLDIINTLSKHYERSAPVIIDNAEAITDIPELDLQIIALYVDKEYQKLTVNPSKEPVAA